MPSSRKGMKFALAGVVVATTLVAVGAAGVFLWPQGEARKTARKLGLLQALGVPPGPPLYIALPPIKDETNASPEVAELTEKLVRQRLTEMGATFAPAGETEKAAQDLIKDRNLQGWQLMVKVLPQEVKGADGLKIDIVCLTYPEKLLKGSANARAAGAKQTSLVKAMVPRVIGDIADECEWAL